MAVRRDTLPVARRLETELGPEPVFPLAACPAECTSLPAPLEPIIVGIDGGYLRYWKRKQTHFVAIVGESVPADGPAKRFGFVQSHDPKPRRHLAAVLDSQGVRHNQELVFLSDGEEGLRQLQCYLRPHSQHSARLVPPDDAGLQPGPVPQGAVSFGRGMDWRAAGSTRAHEVEPVARQSQARPRVAQSDRGAHVVLRELLHQVLGAGAGGARLAALPLAERAPDPQLRPTAASGPDDLDRFRRVAGQLAAEQALRQEAVDAMDARRRPPPAPGQDSDAQRRARGHLPQVVPAFSLEHQLADDTSLAA